MEFVYTAEPTGLERPDSKAILSTVQLWQAEVVLTAVTPLQEEVM
jgi:hypothetical protein